MDIREARFVFFLQKIHHKNLKAHVEIKQATERTILLNYSCP